MSLSQALNQFAQNLGRYPKCAIFRALPFRKVDSLIAMIKLRCSGLPIRLPAPVI